jgi:hypothetical protein
LRAASRSRENFEHEASTGNLPPRQQVKDGVFGDSHTQQNQTELITVAAVLEDIRRNPRKHLIERWNWKSALTSSLLRGMLYFFVNVSHGIEAATGAMLAEWIFRTGISGAYGSMTQSFRHAQPAWKANLFILAVLPLTSHTLEFLLHYFRGTPQLTWSTIASVTFTILATLFNLYAMRRGVLVVDEGKRPFREDLVLLPGILAGFLAAGPMALWRRLRSR